MMILFPELSEKAVSLSLAYRTSNPDLAELDGLVQELTAFNSFADMFSRLDYIPSFVLVSGDDLAQKIELLAEVYDLTAKSAWSRRRCFRSYMT